MKINFRSELNRLEEAGILSRREFFGLVLSATIMTGASLVWLRIHRDDDQYAAQQAQLNKDLSATATAAGERPVAGNAYNVLSSETMHRIMQATGVILFMYKNSSTDAAAGTAWVVHNGDKGLVLATAGHVVTDKGGQPLDNIQRIAFGRPRDPSGFAQFEAGQTSIHLSAGRTESGIGDDVALIQIPRDAVPSWLREAPALPVGRSTALKVGEQVVAAGVPREFMPPVVTDGSLAQTTLYANMAPVTQISADGSFRFGVEGDGGMSGGPVVRVKPFGAVGLVIGDRMADIHQTIAADTDALVKLLEGMS